MLYPFIVIREFFAGGPASSSAWPRKSRVQYMYKMTTRSQIELNPRLSPTPLSAAFIISLARKNLQGEHRSLIPSFVSSDTPLCLPNTFALAALSNQGGNKHTTKHGNRLLRSHLNGSDNSDGIDPRDAVGGELVSALARLDRKWELARREEGTKKIGEWTVLDVSDGNNPDVDRDPSWEYSTKKPEIVYLLEPESGASPSCIIFFLGGAVLGQFPHISYSAFLRRLSLKMNASVVAIPYEVGLDHFRISQLAVNRMKQAVLKCEDSRGYPLSLPKYAIGHSLGAKLHCIGIAATGIGEELSGTGLISYNNFGFGETIKMSRSFAKEMKVGSETPPLSFDTIIDLAEMAVTAVGLEFSPNPYDTDRILKSKFDEGVLKKTRLFVFDDDDLDSTMRFMKCFEDNSTGSPSISNLPGTHLTPVYLKLGVDDLPEEAKDIAGQVSGGFQNASFGDESNLDSLVEEVSNWMLGRGPSSKPVGQKLIPGVIDAEVDA